MMKTYRVLEIITGTKVVLNCGREHGISLWDNFEVYGLTKVLIDPDTKEELGRAEIIRGKGRVIHIQDKLCTIESYLEEAGSTRRIIKKTTQLGNLWSGLPTSEEEITGEPRIKRFEDIQVGDYARVLKK